MVETESSLFLEQGSAALYSARIKSQRKSPAHEVHSSPPQIVQSLSSACDLSPHRETKGSVWRPRNIHPSHIPALSSLCGEDSCSNCSNSSGHSTSTTGKSKKQNRQQKTTHGDSSVSTGRTDKNRIRCNSSQNCSSRIDSNRNDEFGKDVKQEKSFRSPCLTDHRTQHSESSDESGQSAVSQPVCIQIQGQMFASPRRPLGTKSVQEVQTELEMISKFYQPVPPARVST